MVHGDVVDAFIPPTSQSGRSATQGDGDAGLVAATREGIAAGLRCGEALGLVDVLGGEVVLRQEVQHPRAVCRNGSCHAHDMPRKMDTMNFNALHRVIHVHHCLFFSSFDSES